MRGTKALITTDDVQKKIVENICNMEALYSCIFSHQDDQMCMINKIIYKECMQSMIKKQVTKTGDKNR